MTLIGRRQLGSFTVRRGDWPGISYTTFLTKKFPTYYYFCLGAVDEHMAYLYTYILLNSSFDFNTLVQKIQRDFMLKVTI